MTRQPSAIRQPARVRTVKPVGTVPAIERWSVMSPEAPATDRPLASDDRALHPGWELLEFLASIGANEFSVRFMYAGDNGKSACDRLVRKLASSSLGEHTRECTLTYAKEGNPRPVEVWCLDASGREALLEIMPDGVLGSSAGKDAWAEDLCVYRRGELVFGTVTHEGYAFLRLNDAQWRQWEGHSTAAQRAKAVGRASGCVSRDRKPARRRRGR